MIKQNDRLYMNWLFQIKVWIKYIIPAIIFIIFLSCGIWLWTSYFTPWGYSYSNGRYTVTYTFYDTTYSWKQEYPDGRTYTGNGTYDIYVNVIDGTKYTTLIGHIHNASGTDHKTFSRVTTHSLKTFDDTGNTRLEEVTYTCQSALIFEVFCGLFISITTLYFIVQVFLYYRKVLTQNVDKDGALK